MRFIFYHHKNLALAKYVAHYADLPSLVPEASVEYQSVPQQSSHNDWAELPTGLRRLLFFARPDVTICFDDGRRPIHPVFAFEITTHVPARDHWMQRFVNLVGCAQEHIPGAYIMPFDMSSHEKFKSKIDSYFFLAYERVTEIHQTPIFIAEWETIGNKTLRLDNKFQSQPSSEMPDIKRAFAFLRTSVEAAYHGRSISSLMRERSIVELRDRLRAKAYSSTLPSIKDFKRLAVCMPNDRLLTTAEFDKWLESIGQKRPADFPERMIRRDKYLIFTPQADHRNKTREQLRKALLTRIDKKGGDPYLGQPLAFDYIFCRLGETPYERDCSVIANLTDLRFGDLAKFHRKAWEENPLQYTDLKDIKHIPTYTMYLKEGGVEVLKNFLRVYAFSADAIVFADGMVYF